MENILRKYDHRVPIDIGIEMPVSSCIRDAILSK